MPKIEGKKKEKTETADLPTQTVTPHFLVFLSHTLTHSAILSSQLPGLQSPLPGNFPPSFCLIVFRGKFKILALLELNPNL